jgi:ACS family hexuronate transporter-like MFS transporter
MTSAVTIWTVASALHAFATGLLSLGGLRFALGFGEGATFPGGLRTAVQTLPAEQRSRGIAVAYSGGSLGALVTPLLVTPIALRWGWRGAFWFTGAAGAAWIASWLVISRSPSLRRKTEPAVAGETASVPSFRDPRVWGFMSIYAFGGLPLAFVLYGAAIYLANAVGKTQAEIGRLLWIPPLGWETGYFFWGWVTDRFTAHGESTPDIRRLFALLAFGSLALAGVPAAGSLALAMPLMFLSMFLAGGFVIAAVAYATAIFSPRNAGFIAGLGAGSWSALVAVVMPGFGRLFDAGRYDAAFWLAGAAPLIGWALWIALAKQRREAGDLIEA